MSNFQYGKLELNSFFHLDVEFFFLVSGYFLAANVDNNNNQKAGEATIAFTIKRIKAIFPEHIIAYIGTFLAYIVYKHNYSIEYISSQFLTSLPSLFLISKIGLPQAFNGQEWYISQLIIVGSLLYLLLISYRKTFSCFLAPIMSVYFFGLMAYNSSSLYNTDIWLMNLLPNTFFGQLPK